MFQLCTKFKDVPFHFWIDETNETSKNFWATARQIGKLLGFRNGKAIEKIANAHHFHLYHPVNVTFSNGRTKTLYRFMDMIKFCKSARLPEHTANEIIDFLWKISDDVYAMKTGTCINITSSDNDDDDYDNDNGNKKDKSKDTSKECPQDSQESADKAAPDCDVVKFMKGIRHELSHVLSQIESIRERITLLQAEKRSEAHREAKFWEELGSLCSFLSKC